MAEARCDEHVGEAFPRRCAACDRATAEVAAERAGEQLRACERHVRLLPCPECADEQPLSAPVVAQNAPSGPVARRRRRSVVLPPSVPSDATTAGEGSQNLAPEARWDRLG